MNWWLLVIPLLSAFIGWLINLAALKMLFHPRKPKKIFGITFQGLIPRQQHRFALEFGQLVSLELLSFDQIEQKLSSAANIEKVLPLLETHIDTFLRIKLPAKIPMLSMVIGDRTIGQVKAVFLEELEELFPTMIKQSMFTLQHELNPENIVVSKLSAFSSNKLEDILHKAMSAEFRLVKIIGAASGFIIGVVQVIIILAIT